MRCDAIAQDMTLLAVRTLWWWVGCAVSCSFACDRSADARIVSISQLFGEFSRSEMLGGRLSVTYTSVRLEFIHREAVYRWTIWQTGPLEEGRR